MTTEGRVLAISAMPTGPTIWAAPWVATTPNGNAPSRVHVIVVEAAKGSAKTHGAGDVSVPANHRRVNGGPSGSATATETGVGSPSWPSTTPGATILRSVSTRLLPI